MDEQIQLLAPPMPASKLRQILAGQSNAYRDNNIRTGCGVAYRDSFMQIKNASCSALRSHCNAVRQTEPGYKLGEDCTGFEATLRKVDILPLSKEARSLRLLCLVNTCAEEHCGRAQALMLTYLRKCDHVAYSSDKEDVNGLPGSIALPHFGKEAYSNLWEKTRSVRVCVFLVCQKALAQVLCAMDGAATDCQCSTCA